MNPFTLVNGEPYPLDMRGELDDTAAFKNFKKYSSIIYILSNFFFLTCASFFIQIFFLIFKTCSLILSLKKNIYHMKMHPLWRLIYDMLFSDGETLNFLCPLVEC